jgi:CheY-like chemotaxis protein
LLALGLRRARYTVDVAATATEARQLIEAQSYALVIADWMLPDGNGIDLADRALEDRAKTLIISGYLFGLPAGAARRHRLLRKPFSIDDLVAAVQNRMKRHSGNRKQELNRGRAGKDLEMWRVPPITLTATSKGRGRRPAAGAADQTRTSYQSPKNRPSALSYRAADAACPRRRDHRIERPVYVRRGPTQGQPKRGMRRAAATQENTTEAGYLGVGNAAKQARGGGMTIRPSLSGGTPNPRLPPIVHRSV